MWDVSGVSTARMGRVVMNSFETNVVCENPRIHSVGGLARQFCYTLEYMTVWTLEFTN